MSTPTYTTLIRFAPAADSGGYAAALAVAERHAPGRRAFAVEGSGSYGAGLTRFLTGNGEQVFEVGRLRRERSAGKTDALDAVRAARSVLAQERPATPRDSGEREALRALMAAREGAANAKRAGLCQLRALLVTTPEPLRAELRSLTRARLLVCLTAMRPERRTDPELRGILLALRAVARRVQQLTAEERELAREIKSLTEKLAPQLLDQPGVGPLLAAQVVLSWSHKGRIKSEAAFARSPASPRSQHPRDRRSATASTAAATANSTEYPHDRRHPSTHRPRDDRLHRTPHQRRQNAARSDPLPQALPRPQPLQAPRERSLTDQLTNKEASLAQARDLRRRQIDSSEGEHLAVVPNTVRLAVVSEDSFTDKASFLDHATRSGVRHVSLGLDPLKSALSDRPASDQPQRSRSNTLSASLRKHRDSDRACAVGDDAERDESECAVGHRIGDHEGRPLALRPRLAGIAKGKNAAHRDWLIFQPPLRLRIVTRSTDKRPVLRLAEAQDDLAVGQRMVGWRQFHPTTLTKVVRGRSSSPRSSVAIHTSVVIPNARPGDALCGETKGLSSCAESPTQKPT